MRKRVENERGIASAVSPVHRKGENFAPKIFLPREVDWAGRRSRGYPLDSCRRGAIGIEKSIKDYQLEPTSEGNEETNHTILTRSKAAKRKRRRRRRRRRTKSPVHYSFTSRAHAHTESRERRIKHHTQKKNDLSGKNNISGGIVPNPRER